MGRRYCSATMPHVTRSATGYSTWRLIADQLRSEIVDGSFPPEVKLPTEGELADRFGVHRNTVRQAVAALAAEGLVATRQGSGTFVVPHTLLVHRISLRTRLSESIGRPGATSHRPIAAEIVASPPHEVATRLRLDGRPALQVETVADVNGTTVARSTAWFDVALTPDLDIHLRQTRSITKALRAVGIDDYVRTWSAVSSRIANGTEAEDMNFPAGSIVLVVRSVNTLVDRTPLQYTSTRFRADRVELDIDFDAFNDLGGDRRRD
ncbi:phosphonate metabolism transcriptional regulator PhnF [Streptomyces albiflaviniger]|nr:phosphonate metabolism transcriptional regulator PhnF [Streptomyces albiflaviniger]